MAGLKTKAVGLNIVPYIMINGINNKNLTFYAHQNLLGLICQLYEGNENIAACL